MPMKRKFLSGDWVADVAGWGLLDAATRKPISPVELVSDQKIEMTPWEVHDMAVQIVRDYLANEGFELMSWQGNPEVDPSIWFIGETKGPVMTVAVDPGLVRARSVWLESNANEIRELVYNGGDIPPHLLANPKVLRDVAKAVAARIYESMARRLDGNRVRVPFKPDLHPAGALAEVEHILNTDGRLISVFSLFHSFEPRDLLAYLPEGTKRTLQRAAVSDRRR